MRAAPIQLITFAINNLGRGRTLPSLSENAREERQSVDDGLGQISPTHVSGDVDRSGLKGSLSRLIKSTLYVYRIQRVNGKARREFGDERHLRTIPFLMARDRFDDT